MKEFHYPVCGDFTRGLMQSLRGCNIPNDQEAPDVLHRYYQEQLQIDGGKMDKYALYNTSAGLSEG
jgi:phospholipase C